MPVLHTLFNTDRVNCHAQIGSKKRALQTLAELLASSDEKLKARKIFDQFCERERLGSTGIGSGIGIPHCRMDGLQAPVAALLTLDQTVDFDAPDNQPVKLLIGLMVPSEATDQHLELLANIAKLFSEPDKGEAICRATTPSEVIDLLHPLTPGE